MKVLFWSECFLPHIGGVEIFAKQLIETLSARGFEFAVITSTLENSLEEEDYLKGRIYRLPLRQGLAGDPKAFQFSLKKIAYIKNYFKPDLSHINTTGPAFIYHLQTKTIHLHPSIFTFHFYPPSIPLSNPTLNKMLEYCHWATAVAPTSLKVIRKYAPFLLSKSSYIYNALEWPTIKPSPLSWDPPILLGIGRMVHDKGFDLAIEALAELRNKFPDVQLHLVGKGPEDENLKDLAKNMGLAKRVKFLGFLSKRELYHAINKSTLLVVPSRHLECFGLVALEAMQLGRPVIAARSGGIVDLVKDGETGLLIPQNDSMALANAIEIILKKPSVATAMGSAGRQRAMKEFSLDLMATQYDELFRKVLNSSSQ